MARTAARSLYGSDRSAGEQERAFRSGEVPVAVYGLGKMGLPLAAVYAAESGRVTGVDIDEDTVAQINRGECPVSGEPGLSDLVEQTVGDGALDATTDARAAAEEACVHVVVVPVTLQEDQSPDLSALRSVLGDVGPALSRGDMVIVESTLPPTTCRDVVAPTLARESGLDTSEFGVAFCPERTSSGRALRDIRHAHPKVVGGLDAESTRVAALVYGTITSNDVLTVDATTAECVKVFEGVYRDVNIALANELAGFAEAIGADVNEAIEVANTQPYCDIHTPGPGVGGHCIPYYPYFLLGQFDADAPLIRTARAVNDTMPLVTVDAVADQLAVGGTELDGATVLVLGLAYRAGVAETRKSPGVDIAALLHERGATVLVADPVVDTPDALADRGIETVSASDAPDLDLDAAVLVTDHAEFDAVRWEDLDPMVVVDGRQALSLADSHHRLYTIGTGVAGDD